MTSPNSDPPPRAYSQVGGLLFQVVGVLVFLSTVFVWGTSSLLTNEWAARPELTQIGWHRAGDATTRPSYSARRALTLSVYAGILLGAALVGIGMALQAGRRAAPWIGLMIAAIGTIFWLVQVVFVMTIARSVIFAPIAIVLAILFAILCLVSLGAIRQMRRNQPKIAGIALTDEHKIA